MKGEQGESIQGTLVHALERVHGRRGSLALAKCSAQLAGLHWVCYKAAGMTSSVGRGSP